MSNKSDGWKGLLSGKNLWKSIALAGGTALHATNIYLSTTILPSVVEDIGGLEFYSWNTSLFMVASIIGSVISSRILVSKGPKVSYRIASFIFIIGTIVCGIAPAMTVMLMGRFIQGFGGGILFALSYAMIQIVFTENLWSRAMALISGMWGIAALTGPFIGGIFAEMNEWRLAFVALIPISLGVIAISERLLPNQTVTKSKKNAVPWIKLTLLTLATLAVSVGSIFYSVLYNSIGLIAAIAFLVIIVRLEKTSSNRLLPNGAYQINHKLGSLYLIMALLVISTTSEIFVPYFLQIVQGKSPFVSGYLAALMAIGWTLASLLFSGIKEQLVKPVIITGPLIMVIALTGLTTFMPSAESKAGLNFYLLCSAILFLGFGIGLVWPHLLTFVFKSAEKGQEELASASITTVQLIATAFGAALAGMIANLGGLTNPGGLEGTSNSAFWLFAVFTAFPLTGLFVSVYHFRQKSKSE